MSPRREVRLKPLLRVALLACLAVACASSAAVAPPPGDAAFVAPVDVPPDPLDDPTARVDCPPGRPDPCGPGRHCIAVGPGFQGICVRDGARGGLCRETALACDESIPCLESWCDQNNHFGPRTRCGGRFCGLGEGCVELDGALGCVAHGGPGGYCRQLGAACDPGFACDNRGNNRSRCVRPIPLGGQCGLASGGVDVCETAAACVGDGATGVCRPLGSEGAPCRGGATCDGGLECQLLLGADAVRCVRPRMRDELCDVATRGLPRCAVGLSCAVVEASTLGRCRPVGSLLAICRDVAPQCDAGLRCNVAFRVCSTTLPTGAACSPRSNQTECVEGSNCLSAGAAARCLADGSRGGLCRMSEDRCDPGLACLLRGTALVCVGP